MKKFLIAILFLVPVVIVLAIAAAGNIISSSVSVMPVSIAVRDSNNELIEEGSYITLDIADADAYIIIEVLPSIVQDGSVTFQFDNIENATGAVLLERIEETNRYRILPKSAGEARVIISSTLDANVRRAVTFWVRSDTITSVLIYDETNAPVSTVRLTKPARLFADIYPIDALDTNLVSWRSDNEDIVTVSKNGVLVPVKQGATRVWFSVKDRAGITHHESVFVDASNALIRAETVYANEAVTAAWVKEKVVLAEDATVLASGDRFLVSRGADTAAVRVLPCETGEKGFLDGLAVLYTQNGPYFLEGGALEGSAGAESGVRFHVSDGTVARIAGSEIVPLKGGTVTVTATFADGKTAEKTLVVKERPFSFELNLNSEDAVLGIQRTRTWGIEWLNEDYSVRNTYQMFVKTAGERHYDLLWTADKPDCVTVDPETGHLTFLPAAHGESIKITAAVVINGGYVTRTAKSFTFRVHAEEGLTNIETEAQIHFMTRNRPLQALVLQADLYTTEEIRLSYALYGNGFKVSGENRDLEQVNSGTVLINVENDTQAAQSVEKVIVEDVAIQGTPSYEECAGMFKGFFADGTQKPVELKFLSVKHCNHGIDFRNPYDVLLEGIIAGDNYSTSIYFANKPHLESHIILRNCVLKYSEGPAAFFNTNGNAMEMGGEVITPNVRIEGFLEVYNWKKTDDLAGILIALDVEDMNLSDISPALGNVSLLEVIGKALEDIFSQPKLARLVYRAADGDDYVSMGPLFLGFAVKQDPGRVVFDRSMPVDLFEIPLKGLSGSFGSLLHIADAILSGGSPDATILNSLYYIGYDFGGNTPVHKPGEAIPQDEALYSRLTSFEPAAQAQGQR